MRQHYQNIMLIELGALGAALVIGLIALLKKSTLFIFLALYFLVVSLLCEAIILWYTYRQQEAIKHVIRAMMLFLLSTFLLFFL